MRRLLLSLTLSFFASGTFILDAQTSKISQLSNGILSGNSYSNDELGLRFDFPDGWTATLNPKYPTMLDYRKPDELANQCSKILLSLQAPHPVEGRFNSMAALFAIDPGCFSGTEFPHSLNKAKIVKLTDKIIKTYSHSPFISPYGANYEGYLSQGRVFLQLTHGVIINALVGHPAAKKEPLNVNNSIVVTESNGYWVAWAYIADEPSEKELKDAKLAFKDASPQ